MWNNFCAVVEDLFWFAWGAGESQKPHAADSKARAGTLSLPLYTDLAPVLLPSPIPAVLLPVATGSIGATAHTTARATPMAKAKYTHVEPPAAILHAPVVMYVSKPLGTNCLHVPQIDFDSVIEVLPYGTAVTVIGYDGRFASVNRSNITGWVLKDDILPQKNEVWPEFVSGVVYDAQHADTQRSRFLMTDMFAGGSLALPLQAGEYIAVRLKSEHRMITWTRKRPRVAGAWARLLRGTAGIHIGVTPKTDTVMEWQESDGEGRLGYVEAVAPDQAITISAVGVDESGRYTVKTMSEEIWRELRPVFIEVA